MSVIFYRDPDGPGVEVVANLRRNSPTVGLIAQPKVDHDWVNLTPAEARAVAAALTSAAAETERDPVRGASA